MYIVIGIVIALTVFTAVVFFHELGHFFVAKLAKIKVEEFWIGIPPRAKRFFQDRSGTEYTLNWLPIGGFVRLKGESEGEERSTDKDSFVSKSYFAKSAVMLAGVAMNFLFAWIILTGLFFVGVSPLGINTKFSTNVESLLVPTFEQARKSGIVETDGVGLSPLSGSIAMKSGIQEGDIVRKANTEEIRTPESFISLVKSSHGPIDLEIERNHQTLHLKLSPENGKIGSYVSYNITNIRGDHVYKYDFPGAIKTWYSETASQIRLTWELLESLVQKLISPKNPEERKEATESLSGPIAIGGMFVDLAKVNVPLTVILSIAALISVNLGVFNLLPFPALDGGRFASLTITGMLRFLTRGKITGQKLEARAHMIGFILLMALSLYVAYNDISRFF